MSEQNQENDKATSKRLGQRHPGLAKAIRLVSAAFLLGLGLLLGYALTPASNDRVPNKPEHSGHGAKKAGKSGQAKKAHKKQWTCSMHPQIRSDKPGKCPICGMDLVPVEDAPESGSGTSGSAHAGHGDQKASENVARSTGTTQVHKKE